jgi:Xaa-Pro aminopeptidase
LGASGFDGVARRISNREEDSLKERELVHSRKMEVDEVSLAPEAIQEEMGEKERRVREFLERNGYKAVLFKRQANFSWMTCGGLNTVGITTDLGATSLLILPERKFLISNNIEAPRMMEEEGVVQKGFEVEVFDWYEDREVEIVKKIVGGQRIASDLPFPEASCVPEELARLRYSLTPQEVLRYRWLGRKVSEIVEKTLQHTRPGEKECEVVGRLARGLWEHRIDYVTLMAAADERIFRFRHPIPMENPIKNYFMLSVNARKWGLIVSLTRFVHFGSPPETLRSRYRANVIIDCTFMAATKPGKKAKEVVSKGLEAYEKLGYKEEWKLHHQGGAIGYTGRDYRANLQTDEIVRENQAFTWNPSITGTKSEDTILATNQGPIMITSPMIYPTITLEVEGLQFTRPDILVR